MAKAKEIPALDCGANAPDAIRMVLLERLEEVCQFRAAALDWSDIEGVHDMRVASRRLRSALRDFRPYLRGKIGERKLREVARALGAVRDEDVAIAALEKLAGDAPEDVAAGVNYLIDERKVRRDRARLTLEGMIAETALTRLSEKLAWRVVRATRRRADETAASEDGAAARDAALERINFRRAGREIILDRLEELKELSDSLYRPFDTEPLHEMRIAAKRLRYAMELFAQCWEGGLAWFSEEVAHMQESLGELHDCDDWLADFGKRLARGARGSKRGDRTPEEAQAIRSATFWLMENFSKERAKHYRKALERWHEWERAAFGVRLSETLDAEPASPEPASTEPSSAEQSSAEPANPESSGAESPSTEPASIEPATAEPTIAEPVTSEPEPSAQVLQETAAPEIQNQQEL